MIFVYYLFSFLIIKIAHENVCAMHRSKALSKNLMVKKREPRLAQWSRVTEAHQEKNLRFVTVVQYTEEE